MGDMINFIKSDRMHMFHYNDYFLGLFFFNLTLCQQKNVALMSHHEN